MALHSASIISCQVCLGSDLLGSHSHWSFQGVSSQMLSLGAHFQQLSSQPLTEGSQLFSFLHCIAGELRWRFQSSELSQVSLHCGSRFHVRHCQCHHPQLGHWVHSAQQRSYHPHWHWLHGPLISSICHPTSSDDWLSSQGILGPSIPSSCSMCMQLWLQVSWPFQRHATWYKNCTYQQTFSTWLHAFPHLHIIDKLGSLESHITSAPDSAWYAHAFFQQLFETIIVLYSDNFMTNILRLSHQSIMYLSGTTLIKQHYSKYSVALSEPSKTKHCHAIWRLQSMRSSTDSPGFFWVSSSHFW